MREEGRDKRQKEQIVVSIAHTISARRWRALTLTWSSDGLSFTLARLGSAIEYTATAAEPHALEQPEGSSGSDSLQLKEARDPKVGLWIGQTFSGQGWGI